MIVCKVLFTTFWACQSGARRRFWGGAMQGSHGLLQNGAGPVRGEKMRPRFTEMIFSPMGTKVVQLAALLFIVAMVPFIGFLVYQTGGTQYVWPYLMILPISVAGMVFKVPGGLIVALIGGIILGPFMPLDSFAGIPQRSVNWLTRLSFLCVIGGFIGTMASILHAQLLRAIYKTHYDSSSGLLKADSLPMLFGNNIPRHGEGPVLATVEITNYKNLTPVFGAGMAGEFVSEVFRSMGQKVSLKGGICCRIDVDTMGAVFPDAEVTEEDVIAILSLAIPRSFVVRHVPLPVITQTGVARAEFTDLLGDRMFLKPAIACDMAKRNGSRFGFYDPGVRNALRGNIALMGELITDLDDGKLELHYQPQISLESGQAIGAEALLRWNHKTKGYISPASFIPLAESSLIIHQITQWVICRTIQQMTDWKSNGTDLRVSINFSSSDLHNDETIGLLMDSFAAAELDPSLLEVEVTETSIMVNPVQAAETLTRLRNFGFRIAIDDFGTGYSSLERFQSLNVDTVKIDRAFVSAMRSSSEALAIVKMVAAICHGRGIDIVAEGIEDVETMHRLASIGCMVGQGYYFARPMAPGAFMDWLSGEGSLNLVH